MIWKGLIIISCTLWSHLLLDMLRREKDNPQVIDASPLHFFISHFFPFSQRDFYSLPLHLSLSGEDVWDQALFQVDLRRRRVHRHCPPGLHCRQGQGTDKTKTNTEKKKMEKSRMGFFFFPIELSWWWLLWRGAYMWWNFPRRLCVLLIFFHLSVTRRTRF